ncbi:helix-turn-helix transcriptional regulator [Mycobacterium sp. 050134]|uniref:helix-turn-helix transcriptional regulator n=1 Tax=Mycobacterium sp. 050134 TaxID=3096111 RepID=UPI002ED901F2
MAETFIGRHAEEQAVTEFLDSVPHQSGALVIEGEPGIGKTTVWVDAVERARARGFRTLSCRAAAAESVLAYTALADLLSDVDDSVWSDLPAPQQRALAGALLRHPVDADDIDPRAVAAAFVTVVARLAAEHTVVIAIDDLQWVDTSSANAVSYAVRRLPAGAGMVCTTRSEDVAARVQLPIPGAVRRMRLRPFGVGELHRILLFRLGRSVARPTLLRIHQIAGGNPFFALELARELGPEGHPAGLSLPGSLGELVRSRISRLGAEDVLLAMASLADPAVPIVARATKCTADRLVRSLAAAEAHEVVSIDGKRLRFTHPILAHGVYTAAPPGRRREMHRRLADLVEEPELRARHLALSDATGDPRTVEALDLAAEMARRRGAPAAAAELLELAIGLGADSPERRIRLASHHFSAGDADRARTVLEQTVERPAPPPLRAEALRLLGQWSLLDGSSREAAELLDRALGDVGDDLALRTLILVPLSFAFINIGRRDRAAASVEDAVAAAEAHGQPDLLSQALSMRVQVRFLLGEGVDEPGLQRALDLEDSRTAVSALLRPRVQDAIVLAATGRLDQARLQLRTIRHSYIERGEESELMMFAFHSGLNEVWRADFAEAGRIADDAMERALLLGRDLPLAVALMLRAAVAAYTGSEPEARRDAGQALAVGARCDSPGLVTVWPTTILGFLEVSAGNHAAAVTTLEPLLRDLGEAPHATEIYVAPYLPDAVEAMIGLGRLDDAEPLIAALERNGRRLDRPWMLATGARCRAMLLAGRGDTATAVTVAQSAMNEHQRLPMPFERARTQLLLGQLHRRQRRRDAATAVLDEASRTFRRLGSWAWADRAEAELARGGSGRRGGHQLTTTEERVAELAASGMSNRDIAAALFISVKTVEFNLSRIYRKLNIRSRAQIHLALQREVNSGTD